MKRLLLGALMVVVSLVGTVGVSGAADKEIQTVITQLQEIHQTLSAMNNTIVALQAKAKSTDGAVTELPAKVTAGSEYEYTSWYLPAKPCLER